MSDKELDLLETAWGLIANAGGGNWETETREWQIAAARFREAYFNRLRRYRADTPPTEEKPR